MMSKAKPDLVHGRVYVILNSQVSDIIDAFHSDGCAQPCPARPSGFAAVNRPHVKFVQGSMRGRVLDLHLQQHASRKARYNKVEVAAMLANLVLGHVVVWCYP